MLLSAPTSPPPWVPIYANEGRSHCGSSEARMLSMAAMQVLGRVSPNSPTHQSHTGNTYSCTVAHGGSVEQRGASSIASSGENSRFFHTYILQITPADMGSRERPSCLMNWCCLRVVGQGHNFLLWYHWDVIGEQTTNRRRTGDLP